MLEINLNASYYSYITMATIAYGEFTPSTAIERNYAIISILIACGIFGYSLNIINGIFQGLALKEQNY